MKTTKLYRGALVASLLGLLAISVSSCVPLAIGAAGGYVLNDQGYKLQAPLTKQAAYTAPSYETPNYETPLGAPVAPAPPVYTDY